MYFGYNLRLCFNAAQSADVSKAKKHEVTLQILDVSVEESNISQLLRSSGKEKSDVAHSIFVIFPRNKDRLFAQCKFGKVSLWAFDILLDACETQRANAVTDFYEYIQGASDAATLWESKGKVAVRFGRRLSNAPRVPLCTPLANANHSVISYLYRVMSLRLS